MFKPRKIEFSRLLSRDGWDFKVYHINAEGNAVDASRYEQGIGIILPDLLSRETLRHSPNVGYIICHEGSSMSYLVACVWGNDNELFVEVRVWEKDRWINSREYSFCLYDMEVMWFERNAYIFSIYSGQPDREQYLKLHHNANT